MAYALAHCVGVGVRGSGYRRHPDCNAAATARKSHAVRTLSGHRRLGRDAVGPADGRTLPGALRRRWLVSAAESSSASPRLWRVALTGGIASGKSTVSELFARLGAPII